MNELPSDPPNLLAAFLAETDVPCPGCGYNLRALIRETCPECGQALVLNVGLREPRMAAFVAGLVGLACGMGFSGLLFLYFVSIYFRGSGPRFLVFPFIAVTAVGLILEGLMLIVWLRLGRKIRRIHPTNRRLLVIACWAVTFTNLAVFTLMIR